MLPANFRDSVGSPTWFATLVPPADAGSRGPLLRWYSKSSSDESNAIGARLAPAGRRDECAVCMSASRAASSMEGTLEGAPLLRSRPAVPRLER
eukprot:scaffold137398_cov39-Tisochrysis_lutea.AAC.2